MPFFFPQRNWKTNQEYSVKDIIIIIDKYQINIKPFLSCSSFLSFSSWFWRLTTSTVVFSPWRSPISLSLSCPLATKAYRREMNKQIANGPNMSEQSFKKKKPLILLSISTWTNANFFVIKFLKKDLRKVKIYMFINVYQLPLSFYPFPLSSPLNHLRYPDFFFQTTHTGFPQTEKKQINK